jgi:hypothetical protein
MTVYFNKGYYKFSQQVSFWLCLLQIMLYQNIDFHLLLQAKRLFLKGIENEQNGKLYEAIQFYRRAVQLVPDIEFRLYDASKLKPRERQEIENSEGKI